MAADRARTRLDSLARVGLDTPAFVASAVEVLNQALPFVAACLAPTDPATELITAAIKYGDLDSNSDDLWAFWEYESPESWNFQTTARRPGGVTTTHSETGGRPDRSARQTEFFHANWGFTDELRAALQIDGHTWGFFALFRGQGATPFTPAEQAFVSTLTPTFARGFRAGLVASAGQTGGYSQGPAVIIVDGHGQIAQASVGAAEQVANLGGGRLGESQLPTVLSTLVGAARAYAVGRFPQVPRMRLRTSLGGWVVAHASPMLAAGEQTANVVITIEEARPPEVIPLVVAAFGLTVREQAVVQLVLQGVSTTEIATALHLSAYTVQDHLKSIFEKAGVRSRRELTARVFYDQYAPRLTAEPSLAPSGWFAPPV